MSIKFACECGTQFIARDEQAGRPGICHACRKQFVVPLQDVPLSAQSIMAELLAENPIEEQGLQPETLASTATTGRHFRLDSSALILIAVPILILAGVVGSLTWAHLNVGADSPQPQNLEPVSPANSPIDTLGSTAPRKEEPPAKTSEQPPAPAPTAPVKQHAEFPVDLRGHAPSVGLSFREVARFEGQTTETADGAGCKGASVTTDMVRDVEHVYTVTAVANDTVTGCLIKVIKGEGTISFVDSRGEEHKRDRVDDLAGEVIVAQKVGSAWKYSLQGKTPTLKQEQALTHLRPLFENRDYLPVAKQKVGATWELDSAQIQNFLGREFSAVSGKLRAEFLRLERLGDDLCAVIEYKGTLKGRDELPQSQGSIRTFEMDQFIYLLPRYGLSAKTSGETIVTSAGKRRTGGASVEVTSTGRITVTSTTTVEH
jgi:hypothetical protein